MAPPSDKCPGPCGAGNGWIEYRVHVIAQLKAHTKSLDAIEMAQQQIREDLRALKVKAAVGCAVVATVVSVAMKMWMQ